MRKIRSFLGLQMPRLRRPLDERDALQAMQDGGTTLIESCSRQNYVLRLFYGSATEMRQGIASLRERLAQFQADTDRTVATAARVNEQTSEVTRTCAAAAADTHELARRAKDAASIATTTQKTVANLVSHSEAIADVVTLIGQVARATQILSYNAAVEAARAGDAGKGFAVVAAEVQRLATQTQEATNDVRRRMSAVSESAVQVDKSVNALDQLVAETATLSRSLATRLQGVLVTVESTANSVGMVAKEARERHTQAVALRQDGDAIGRALVESIDHVAAVKDATDNIQEVSIAFKERLRYLDHRPADDLYPLLPLCELTRSYTARTMIVGTPSAAAQAAIRIKELDADVTVTLSQWMNRVGRKGSPFADDFARIFAQYRDYCLDTIANVARGEVALALKQIGERNVPKYGELKEMLMAKLRQRQGQVKSIT